MRVGDPDGHGVYGQLTETTEGLICHECGMVVQQLATHCYYRHHITADEYRTRHGLPQGARMASRKARGKMRESWQAHAGEHLARLDATRDPGRANRASIPANHNRAPGARASRRAYLQGRAGRLLTTGERHTLDTAETMAAWCEAAWLILEDPTVSQASLAKSMGLKPVTVHARLKRYPRG